jgi:hypothetical protein
MNTHQDGKTNANIILVYAFWKCVVKNLKLVVLLREHASMNSSK